MKLKLFILGMLALLFIIVVVIFRDQEVNHLPVVAIANYGPDATLDDSIAGLNAELARQGFIANSTIRYEIADVGFDTALIPQMVMALNDHAPKVMVSVGTPIAQFAHSAIKNTPLIYLDITDPVDAGLISTANNSNTMTGSSDRQDLQSMLHFVTQLLPHARRIGMLYSTSEANDVALVQMMKVAVKKFNMSVLALPVDQARDVPTVIQKFNKKVDFIYVGASGAIQPTLPVIAIEANKMQIPIINVGEQAIQKGLVLASFGVSYHRVGINAGKLIAAILRGEKISHLAPVYPTQEDHRGFISRSKAQDLGITIPDHSNNITILE